MSSLDEARILRGALMAGRTVGARMPRDLDRSPDGLALDRARPPDTPDPWAAASSRQLGALRGEGRRRVARSRSTVQRRASPAVFRASRCTPPRSESCPPLAQGATPDIGTPAALGSVAVGSYPRRHRGYADASKNEKAVPRPGRCGR